MKKALLTFPLFLLFALPAHADVLKSTDYVATPPDQITMPDTSLGYDYLIYFFLEAIIVFGFLSSILLILMGIFQLVLSRGDRVKQSSAKQKLIFGIVGFLATAAFFVMVNVILSALGLGPESDANFIPLLKP